MNFGGGHLVHNNHIIMKYYYIKCLHLEFCFLSVYASHRRQRHGTLFERRFGNGIKEVGWGNCTSACAGGSRRAEPEQGQEQAHSHR